MFIASREIAGLWAVISRPFRDIEHHFVFNVPILFMDSILMSLTMAGGNINLQLNEVLGVYTQHERNSNHSGSCPSGWKIAILMAYQSYYSLAYPLAMFNIGNSTIEYSGICMRGGNFASDVIVNISNSTFTAIRQIIDNAQYRLTDTIVFFA